MTKKKLTEVEIQIEKDRLATDYEEFKESMASIRTRIRRKYAAMIQEEIRKEAAKLQRDFALRLVDSPLTGRQKQLAVSATAWHRWKELTAPAQDVLAARAEAEEEAARVFASVEDVKTALRAGAIDLMDFFLDPMGAAFDADAPWLLTRLDDHGEGVLWAQVKGRGTWAPIAVLPAGAEVAAEHLDYGVPRGVQAEYGDAVAEAAQKLNA